MAKVPMVDPRNPDKVLQVDAADVPDFQSMGMWTLADRYRWDTADQGWDMSPHAEPGQRPISEQYDKLPQGPSGPFTDALKAGRVPQKATIPVASKSKSPEVLKANLAKVKEKLAAATAAPPAATGEPQPPKTYEQVMREIGQDTPREPTSFQRQLSPQQQYDQANRLIASTEGTRKGRAAVETGSAPTDAQAAKLSAQADALIAATKGTRNGRAAIETGSAPTEAQAAALSAEADRNIAATRAQAHATAPIQDMPLARPYEPIVDPKEALKNTPEHDSAMNDLIARYMGTQ